MKTTINKTTIELICGDITEQRTDAIVNAANHHLIMGGGVAGAILRKGGPEIQADCERKSPTFVGGAVITTAGRLNARHVIHAVGPRMGEGDEDNKLRNATLNTLNLATEHKLESVSFPAISTGIFGYPVDRCARIMLDTAFQHAAGHTTLTLIRFVLYTPDHLRTFSDTLRTLDNRVMGDG